MTARRQCRYCAASVRYPFAGLLCDPCQARLRRAAWVGYPTGRRRARADIIAVALAAVWFGFDAEKGPPT